jgi:hypothetical protein
MSAVKLAAEPDVQQCLLPCLLLRAAEWRHKAIELAVHDKLQRLDRKSS